MRLWGTNYGVCGVYSQSSTVTSIVLGRILNCQNWASNKQAIVFHTAINHSGALAARRAAGAKPHTYRNWTSQRNWKPCIEIGNPCISFLIVITVSSICSGVHGVSVHSYRVGQHGARCLPVDQMINLACTFALVNCHIKVNWQLSRKASADQYHDHIAGSSQNSSRSLFFKGWPLTMLWIFIGSRTQVFSQIITTSLKFEAPLLGLAKSIIVMVTDKGSWKKQNGLKSTNQLANITCMYL